MSERIGDRGNMILCVIGISRNVAHPVALGQVKSIAIHRIDLLMTGSICGLDQLTCFCVGIGSLRPVRRYSGSQTSLVIVGIPSGIAVGICFRETVALPIIGILSSITQRIREGNHISSAIIGIPGSISPGVGGRGHVALGIIGVSVLISIAVLDPGGHPVFVVFKLFGSTIRIGRTGDIAIRIILIFSGVSFPICPTCNLVKIIIGHGLSTAGINGFRDPTLFIKPDLIEISVLAGTDIVPSIKIVGKIKGAKVSGVLMDYAAQAVVLILHIDFAVKVLDGVQIALVIIGISEAVAIGIHHSNQQVSIIGQANTASHAISYLADIAATVLKGETAGGIGDLLKLPTGIAEGNGISIEIRDTYNLAVITKGVGISTLVSHHISAATPGH